MRQAANSRVFEDSLLSALDTVEAVEAFLAANDIALESVTDYGSGFAVIADKDTLLKTPLVLLGWQFRQSKEYGSEFVTAYVMTKTGERGILVDGSTGICRQLREITDTRIGRGMPNAQQGLSAPGGLRRSDYETEITKVVKGEQITETIQATTYYLA
jgi:hypothetical protein